MLLNPHEYSKFVCSYQAHSRYSVDIFGAIITDCETKLEWRFNHSQYFSANGDCYPYDIKSTEWLNTLWREWRFPTISEIKTIDKENLDKKVFGFEKWIDIDGQKWTFNGLIISSFDEFKRAKNAGFNPEIISSMLIVPIDGVKKRISVAVRGSIS